MRMKIAPVTRQTLLDFRDKYKLKPLHLGSMFGLSHPTKWLQITKIEKKEDRDALVDMSLALLYRRYVANPAIIEEIKQDNFRIEDSYDAFNKYLGTTKKGKNIDTDLFSIIIGKKPGFYDRVVRTQDKQTGTVKTLCKIFSDAIEAKDHDTVKAIIEGAKIEAAARGYNIAADEYSKITRKFDTLTKKKRQKLR
ncbi:MAG: hypothetical protein ACC707_17885 [Thiohalomonadales bacterium]